MRNDGSGFFVVLGVIIIALVVMALMFFLYEEPSYVINCKRMINDIVFFVDYYSDVNMSEIDIKIEMKDMIKEWYDKSNMCQKHIDISKYNNYTDYLPIRQG